jgi:acetyl esterase/lipase
MTLRRILVASGILLAALVGATLLFAAAAWWYFNPSFTRVDGTVYGKRGDIPLTFDRVTPTHPNGLGVVLLVSGGWRSGTNAFHPWMTAPLIRRGYTVFAVSHVSQPEATIMDIIQDMHRAIRFIRHHAKDYGVDPDRLGVTGGSAGGHLSLMLVTRGGPGPKDAADPVDRGSSSVQAAAIFYPVTDLIDLGPSTENLHDGGPPKSFVKGFGPNATNKEVWKVIGKESSPIFYVHTNQPPVLILHGGADTLVPVDQSQRFQAKSRELGRVVELIIRPGKVHGWLTMVWDIRLFADWFDHYLKTR